MDQQHAGVFAASSATEEEERRAKLGVMDDGTKPVQVPKRAWRAQVKNVYQEEETQDLAEDLAWLFEDQGRTVVKTKASPEPRRDVINYLEDEHGKEFDDNIQWRKCPEEYQGAIEAIIKAYWDVFIKAGMKRHILGYAFNIDTAKIQPVCCKQPRYGPHEARVIRQLVQVLEDKGLVEDDEGPWGAMVVLAAKPNQGHVHWTEYVFRLCVSYCNLNAVTRPFACFIMRCDDAVEDIGDARHFITLDLDAGYWQVAMHEAAKEKTAFFVPEGKKHWKVMPMGILNAHAFFVAMSTDFKREWNRRFHEDPSAAITTMIQVLERNKESVKAIGIEKTIGEMKRDLHIAAAEGNPDSKVIVDDVMIHDRNPVSPLAYFVAILEVYKRYRVTVNLRKARFLPDRAEFVGIDVTPEGNAPAKSKYEPINNLGPPLNFTDIRTLIGLIGFYYECEVAIFRELLKKEPSPGTATKEEAQGLLKTEWKREHDEQLERLKQAILTGPVLKRPDSNRRFFLKTDWSKDAMGSALLQAETSEEAEEALLREAEGDKCEFDKTLSGLRLRPILFMSRKCKGPERDYHSYVGEAACGRWAMRKLRKWLVGREFTWITDCSGLTKFFEGEANITHTTQRWRMELLAYNFTIVHRPGRMLVECDLLSRYESTVADWREKSVESTVTNNPVVAAFWRATQGPTPWPIENRRPEIRGPWTTLRTDLARVCDTGRATWIVGAGLQMATIAMERLGYEAMTTLQTDEDEYWQEKLDCPQLETAVKHMTNSAKPPPPVEWVLINQADDINTSPRHEALEELIDKAKAQGATTVVMCWSENEKNRGNRGRWNKTLSEFEFHTQELDLKGDECGAAVASRHLVLVATRNKLKVFEGEESAKITGRTLGDVLDLPNSSYSDYCHIAPSNKDTEEKIVNVGTNDAPQTRKVFTAAEVAPNLAKGDEAIGRGEFIVEANDAWVPAQARAIRPWETLQLLGMEAEQARQHLEWNGTKWSKERARVRTTAPEETWAKIMVPILEAELDETIMDDTTAMELTSYGDERHEHLKAMVTRRINQHTTWPLPTRDLWIAETKAEPDLQRIMDSLTNKTRLKREMLQDPAYWSAFEKGRLEVENEILYEYEEPKATNIRQLRRAVVPKKLRDVIISARTTRHP